MRYLIAENCAALIFIVAPFSSQFATASSVCDTHFFDRENLQKIAQSGQVDTLSQILQLAPDCYKSNQVAVYKSHSLHCANSKAPRIILYANTDDGNTICSFNSGSKSDYSEFYTEASDRDCHENAMECQTFNSSTNRFEYFQVSVPKDEKGQFYNNTVKSVLVSEVNPSACLTCHRGNSDFFGAPNPRPNLENYPAWPGMYGSMHDKFAATPSEGVHYVQDFLVNRLTNARYSALPAIVDPSTMRYTTANSKPTVNLQNLLESQNQKRIAAEFTNAKAIEKTKPFRYAILGALACSDERKGWASDRTQVPPQWKFGIETFIPDKLKARFQTVYSDLAVEAFRLQKKNIQSLHDTQTLAGPFSFEQFEAQYQQDIKVDPLTPMNSWQLSSDTGSEFWVASRLGYLGFNLGLPIWDWSMTFQSTLSFEAGAHNFTQLYPLLADALLDPKLDSDVYLKNPYLFTQAPDQAYCTLLRAKSLAALASIADSSDDFRILANSSNRPTGGVFSGSTGSSNVITPPHALQYCIKCHGSGNAIPIPFDDASKLRIDLFSPASTHSSNLLIDEIIQRINSGSMPKNKPISDAEKTDLKDYFLSIFTN